MARADEKKTAAISLKVTPSLKAALDRLAARDRRPLSPYIEMVLDAHVRAHQPSPAQSPARGRVPRKPV